MPDSWFMLFERSSTSAMAAFGRSMISALSGTSQLSPDAARFRAVGSFDEAFFGGGEIAVVASPTHGYWTSLRGLPPFFSR